MTVPPDDAWRTIPPAPRIPPPPPADWRTIPPPPQPPQPQQVQVVQPPPTVYDKTAAVFELISALAGLALMGFILYFLFGSGIL